MASPPWPLPGDGELSADPKLLERTSEVPAIHPFRGRADEPVFSAEAVIWQTFGFSSLSEDFVGLREQDDDEILGADGRERFEQVTSWNERNSPSRTGPRIERYSF